jgi:hypothetical protein
MHHIEYEKKEGLGYNEKSHTHSLCRFRTPRTQTERKRTGSLRRT